MYENDGYDSTLDCIEETIVELERLRATVQGLKGENDHLRTMNKRVIEALSEIAPLQAMYIKHADTLGDAGQNPVVTSTKPAEITASGAADPQGESR
mgnify:CR=1 FL=1